MGRHLKDTVAANLNRYLKLRYTAGSWRNVAELKRAQHVVIPGHETLALKDSH